MISSEGVSFQWKNPEILNHQDPGFVLKNADFITAKNSGERAVGRRRRVVLGDADADPGGEHHAGAWFHGSGQKLC